MAQLRFNANPSVTSSTVKWEDAPSDFTSRHVFLSVYGGTGEGRTWLGMSAPGPMAVFHSSEKLDGIIQKHYHKVGPNGNGKGGVFNFGGTFKGDKDAITKAAQAKVKEFRAAWEDAWRWARTIYLDTQFDLWALYRLAEFGTLTPTTTSVAHLYGPLNAKFQMLFKRHRNQDPAMQRYMVNLVTISMIRERYRNDKPTGIMEQAGFKDFDYMADVVVRTSKRKDNKSGGIVFSGLIEKGWFNAQCEGDSLENEMLNFGDLMGMVTETDPEDWRK